MRLPSKIFSFEESVISKFPAILAILQNTPLSPRELYLAVKGKTEDIGEYLELLDCLYALGKINYDNETGRLTYVG
jgi:hypothetical protein